MEDKILNTILLELKKLNARLDNMDEEMQNKFALIDARFNTLEEFVLSIQNDIGSLQDAMQYVQNRLTNLEKTNQDMQNRANQYQKLESRIRQNEIKIANLSISHC